MTFDPSHPRGAQADVSVTLARIAEASGEVRLRVGQLEEHPCPDHLRASRAAAVEHVRVEQDRIMQEIMDLPANDPELLRRLDHYLDRQHDALAYLDAWESALADLLGQSGGAEEPEPAYLTSREPAAPIGHGYGDQAYDPSLAPAQHPLEPGWPAAQPDWPAPEAAPAPGYDTSSSYPHAAAAPANAFPVVVAQARHGEDESYWDAEAGPSTTPSRRRRRSQGDRPPARFKALGEQVRALAGGLAGLRPAGRGGWILGGAGMLVAALAIAFITQFGFLTGMMAPGSGEATRASAGLGDDKSAAANGDTRGVPFRIRSGKIDVVGDGQGAASGQPPRLDLSRILAAQPLPRPGDASNRADASAGLFVPVLATLRTHAEAMTAWNALRGRYPELLEGRSANVLPDELQGAGAAFRLTVLPALPRAQVLALCGQLRDAGHQICWAKPH